MCISLSLESLGHNIVESTMVKYNCTEREMVRNTPEFTSTEMTLYLDFS